MPMENVTETETETVELSGPQSSKAVEYWR